jgi:hypothetical protein
LPKKNSYFVYKNAKGVAILGGERGDCNISYCMIVESGMKKRKCQFKSCVIKEMTGQVGGVANMNRAYIPLPKG